jgi:hypothetical protein
MFHPFYVTVPTPPSVDIVIGLHYSRSRYSDSHALPLAIEHYEYSRMMIAALFVLAHNISLRIIIASPNLNRYMLYQ